MVVDEFGEGRWLFLVLYFYLIEGSGDFVVGQILSKVSRSCWV